jgi:hypothetical protein
MEKDIKEIIEELDMDDKAMNKDTLNPSFWVEAVSSCANLVNGECTHDKEQGFKHKCPFKQDILDDNESLCSCCQKCTEDCGDDI